MLPDLPHAAARLRAEAQAALGPSAEVTAYLDWLLERQPEGLHAADDVALRSYLAELRARGADRPAYRRALAALKRLYAWAAASHRIAANPFDEYDFDRPWLSRDAIRRRAEIEGDERTRELARLRALNRLAEALHRAPDVRATLTAALEALVDVMALKSAWAFLETDTGLMAVPAGAAEAAHHSFDVPAVCGLPPALEAGDRHALRKPPDCHCQVMLRRGHLRRAVNVVECSRLMEANGDTGGLLFHATVPLSVRGQPVGVLNFATEEWQFLTAADLQLLSAVGAHVSLALERARLFEEAAAQRERLAHELAMAREVQASLLPAELPRIPGFGLATEWRAAREMAGDYFDVLALPEGRFGLVIADVADKGAAAALYMAVAYSRLRAAAERAASRDASPAAALRAVNAGLYRQAATGMFVTMFYAVLDPATRTLTYCNAGHNPPLLRAPDGAVTPLPRGGTALGALPEPRLEDRRLTLAPGQALIAYTDGVTEAVNRAGEEFGLQRLQACLAAAEPTPAALVAAITTSLADFTGDVPQPDDITLMALACTA